MLSSSSALPSPSLSSVPSAVVTSAVRSKFTWQPAIYLVVVLGTVIVIHAPPSILCPPTTPFSPYLPSLLPTVFVAIVAGVIWLIWNDPCIPSTSRGKMEPVETNSAFAFPSGKVLLCHSQRMGEVLTTNSHVSI